jgi:Zn-dependent protease with chaperone function
MPALSNELHLPLVYGRAARHLLNRTLIASLLLVVLAPFVLVAGYVVTAGLVEMASGGSQLIATLARIGHHHQPHPAPDAIADTHPTDRALIVRLLPMTVDMLAAGLVILVWGMSSATTANMLARTGARPSTAAGPAGDAARTLARLSSRAGLATPPKLYIVQCSFPTVFSDGTNVRYPAAAVTTGALDLLDARELEALLAHEVSHVLNRDSRLETILASLAAITEYPFRMFQQISSDPYAKGGLTRNLALVEMLLSPLGLYIFFVSPILNGLIGAMVLRGCEFSADSHAALLTSDPEGLVYALAKIGGVVTVLGKSTVSGLPAHTSLSQRMERIMCAYGNHGFDGLERAIAKGKQYANDRPGMGYDELAVGGSLEHLATLNQGRVHQNVSGEAIPLLDRAEPGALVTARIEPGSLLVVFDTPGRMRQVNTAEAMFGYIRRDVKLKAVEGVLPQEVYDPNARAAVEERLRTEGYLAEPKTPWLAGLTSQQLWMALGFGVAVFVGTSVLLFAFAAK